MKSVKLLATGLTASLLLLAHAASAQELRIGTASQGGEWVATSN